MNTPRDPQYTPPCMSDEQMDAFILKRQQERDERAQPTRSFFSRLRSKHHVVPVAFVACNFFFSSVLISYAQYQANTGYDTTYASGSNDPCTEGTQTQYHTQNQTDQTTQVQTTQHRNQQQTTSQQRQTVSTSDYHVETDRTEVRAGERIEVRWEAPTQTSTNRDWVGVYRAGDGDRQYQEWEYTNGQSNGATTFVFTEPGTYEIRYYKNNGYQRTASSQQIRAVVAVDEEHNHASPTGGQRDWF